MMTKMYIPLDREVSIHVRALQGGKSIFTK